MEQFFEGIRVLDLTNVLSGPYCTYQLALMGASVIKIEPRQSGDLSRGLGADEDLSERLIGSSFLAQNAGKRSMTLNLKHPLAHDLFSQLVKSADVLVENFRPGVMARLGFPWSAAHELNEHLIYCSLSGFGQTGEMSQRPAYDQIIQGLSGMMSVTGSVEDAPLRVGFPICDILAGITGAFAIASALFRRNADGRGRYIDLSMLEVSIAGLGWVLSDYLIAGQNPTPMGNQNSTAAPSGTFDTADGKLNIAANRQQQFELLCKVLGREDLTADPRFQTPRARKHYRSELNSELTQALGQRSAAEWEDELAAIGVPVGRVLSLPEVLDLPQLRERGFFGHLPFPDSDAAMIPTVGNGMQIDGAEVIPQHRPRLLGEDTDEILRELGLDESEITRMRELEVI